MPKDNKDSYVENEVLSPNYFSLDFYQKRKKGKYRLTYAPKLDFSVADSHCHIEMLEKPWWAFIRAAFHNLSNVFCVIDSVDDGVAGLSLVDDAYIHAKKHINDIIYQISINNGHEQATITKDEQPKLCHDTFAISDDPRIPKLNYIVGCHPHYASKFDIEAQENLRKLLKNKKVVCLGEIGLDFHYDISPRKDQIDAFNLQLDIADEFNLPVSLHIREAHSVALDILNKRGFNKAGTLLHCFNLGPQDLKPWVDAGCYIALGGPVTFKKSEDVRRAAKYIPKDRLLLETDAPFMTPEPLRGDTCFPDHVIFTAKLLSDLLKGDNSEEYFLSQVLDNTYNFFDLQ